MGSKTVRLLLLIALAAVPWHTAGAADHLRATDECCGAGASPDQEIGFVPLPEGDVFRPLVADPKAAGSYVAYVRGTSSSPLGTDLGSVGIADRFGLVRWGGPRPGEGLQVGLEGSVFAQFDLNTSSYDLINADYLVGLPVTFRWNGLSARLRIYHQSSHLGDEFVLRSRIPRENFAFQSAEGILSLDGGPLRLYAGGETMFLGIPDTVETRLFHGGVELREQRPALRLGGLAALRFVAGADVKVVQALDWKPAWSAVAGVEIGRPQETPRGSRRWSVLAHYYDGPSPYGQFFRSEVRYYGVGIHFAP